MKADYHVTIEVPFFFTYLVREANGPKDARRQAEYQHHHPPIAQLPVPRGRGTPRVTMVTQARVRQVSDGG